MRYELLESSPHERDELHSSLPLGSTGWFAKNTLALDFWTTDVPTWSTDDPPDQLGDGGLGVRALTNGVVLRLDVAVGDEGWTLRAFSGHAF